MTPAAIVVLKTLPLTESGKIDRQALPEPRREHPGAASFEPPAGPVEEVIADMFSEALEVRPVGAHDNFFELGGHSLAATRLVTRIAKTFRVEAPVRTFFETPTVAAMARFVSSSARPGQAEKVAEVVKRVASLTNDEVKEMLKQNTASGGGP
jgi:acyl carrier protein